jgi:hypothetical protein
LNDKGDKFIIILSKCKAGMEKIKIFLQISIKKIMSDKVVFYHSLLKD